MTAWFRVFIIGIKHFWHIIFGISSIYTHILTACIHTNIHMYKRTYAHVYQCSVCVSHTEIGNYFSYAPNSRHSWLPVVCLSFWWKRTEFVATLRSRTNFGVCWRWLRYLVFAHLLVTKVRKTKFYYKVIASELFSGQFAVFSRRVVVIELYGGDCYNFKA